MIKKLICLVLVLSMLFSLTAEAFATTIGNGEGGNEKSGESGFNFDASDYTVVEDKTLTITVKRNDAGEKAATVSFKFADMLSEYGTDYVVLDSEGKELAFVEGEKPDVSSISAANGNELPGGLPMSETSTPVTSPKGVSAESSGIMGAVNEYLQIPESNAEKARANTENALNELQQVIAKSQGAEGVLSFAKGENEKTITVVPVNNDSYDGTRLIMLSLTGVESEDEKAMIAPDATAYINLVDNEASDVRYTLVDENLVLSSDNPEGEVTIKRISGTDDFSTVYVSTVGNSAAEGTYMKLEEEEVGFLPGETEKTVAVSAFSFVQGGSFGLRIEAADDSGFDCDYISIGIEKDKSLKNFANSIMQNVSGSNTLGSKTGSYDISWGWNGKCFGDQMAFQRNANLMGGIGLSNFNCTLVSNTGRCGLQSRYMQDLAGVRYVSCVAAATLSGKTGWGLDISANELSSSNMRGSNASVSTYRVEPTSSNSYDVRIVSASRFDIIKGNEPILPNNRISLTEYSYKLDVSSLNNPAYLNFWIDGSSLCAIKSIDFEYTLYNLLPQNSCDTFKRSLYDFSDTGSDYEQITFYDGQSSKNYNPGSVKFVYDLDNEFTSFYAGANKNVSIVPANAEEIKANGLVLKGVYFANASKESSSVPKGASAGSTAAGMLYVPANNGTVTLGLNCAFAKQLVDAGVVSAKNPESEDIKVFPVFEHEKATVIFKTGVDNESFFYNISSFFDADHPKYSADGDKIYMIKNYKGSGEDVYAMEVNKASIVRVRGQESPKCSIKGICYAPVSSPNDVQETHHTKGVNIASAVTSSGVRVEQSDLSIADICVMDDYLLYPNLGEQNIFISYFDCYEDDGNGNLVRLDEDEYRPEDLTNRVAYLDDSVYLDVGEEDEDGISHSVVRDAATGEIIENYSGISGKDGIVTVEALAGGVYSFYAQPPEGCYTVWENMTADTNRDGVIDAMEEENYQNSADNTDNPEKVLGNRLTITVDQNNIQYYYSFVPITSKISRTISGTIMKENATFYELVNNINTSQKPEILCGGSAVTIANWAANADASGKYSIKITGLGKSGHVASTAVVDGITYNFESNLARTNDELVLSPLYRFTAEALTAQYNSADNTISEDGVSIKDDTLVIKAEVGNCGNIRPAGAKFKLVRDDMTICEFTKDNGTENSKVEFTKGAYSGTATLSFNPKKYVSTGDNIYVSFCDETGTWYPYINLGYEFIAPQNLGRVFLPLLGASSDDVTVNMRSFDLLGSTWPDTILGSIGDFTVSDPVRTYPTGVSSSDSSVYWHQTQYTYNMNQKLLPSFGGSKSGGNAPAGQDEAEVEEEVRDSIRSLEESDEPAGEKPTKSKFSPSTSYFFEFSVDIGFRLTLSQRTGEEGKIQNYFEDMSFYVRGNTEGKFTYAVALPIGITVAVIFDVEFHIMGIYYMYNNYNEDSTHITGTIPYEGFGPYTPDDKISRAGYFFIDPTVKISLAVVVGIITVGGSAAFAFDLDFRVGDATDAYGGVNIDLSWFIKVLGFKVYNKSEYDEDFKMFGDKPFNFDAGQGDAAKAVMAQAVKKAGEEAFSTEGGEFSLTTPIERDYLENRGDWLGEAEVRQGGTSATSERILEKGSCTGPYTSLTDMGDGKILMVFVDDDLSRTDVNKRAVYYSVSEDNGKTWSEPQQIDNDGTADDYPNAFNLGNGKILVSWSSVENVLPEGASVEDALKQLNIKAAFFDVKKLEFGEVTQLTKTTDEDICADSLPHAAYDADSDRIILYYTKTEYKNLDSVEDFGTNESVIAYLFYEDGKWSNTGDAYTDKEIASAADKDYYREQWYGQRFLDPRVDKSSANMPLIVSSDCISYNHLALYSWVVDWDNNQNTTNDRDVFLQIYNFKENSFSYNIRVTRESGSYTLPTLLRSDSGTYLFYGSLNDENISQVNYLNISEPISNKHYTLCNDGKAKYYVLKYTQEDEDGESVEKWINAEAAAECGNIEDYSVAADGKGAMYIVWSEGDGAGSSQINAAICNNDGWSRPCTITNIRNGYYSDLSAAVLNGKLCVSCGRGSYEDSAVTALAIVSHTPSTNTVLESAAVSNAYPMPGDNVAVTATLKNNGLLLDGKKHTVSVSVNGGEEITADFAGGILGGDTADVIVNVPVPESFDKLSYTVKCDGKTVELEYEREASFSFGEGSIADSSAADAGKGENMYQVSISNIGNMNGDAHVSAYLGDKLLGEAEVSELGAGSSENASIFFDLADSEYTLVPGIDTAYAVITVKATQGDKEIFSEDCTAYKSFDSNAVARLLKLDISEELSAAAVVGETEDVQPESADLEGLRVKWQASSDESIAKVSREGYVTGVKEGTVTLTGVLVPENQRIVFDSFGSAKAADWTELIPDYLVKTVTVTLEVKPAENEPADGPFADVPKDVYFYDAVCWAADMGITKGVDETHFAPMDNCNRAQAVTFLWRMAGCPEPESDNNPFVDVVNGDGMEDYYKAILWASEQGITNGIDETHFAPTDSVIRAQFVTFLWRYDNKTETAESIDEVSDTAEAAEPSHYYKAILWASEQGITNGIDETHFAPTDSVIRAQFVTFLWRYDNKTETAESIDEVSDTAEAAEPYQQDAEMSEENETAESIDEATDAAESSQQDAAMAEENETAEGYEQRLQT